MSKRTCPKKQAFTAAPTAEAWWEQECGNIEMAVRNVMEESKELFQAAWQAGYQAADESWRKHMLSGLRDDPHETIQHMMQRW